MQLKVQEIQLEFEANHAQIKLVVRRHKNYRCVYSITQNNQIVKENSIRSVNLQKCLFEIVRRNNYLPYCNLLLAWSTYEFEKALVDIRLHPSMDGTWEVRIRYRNGDVKNNLLYPIQMDQGKVMDSFIPELGLPQRQEVNEDIESY